MGGHLGHPKRHRWTFPRAGNGLFGLQRVSVLVICTPYLSRKLGLRVGQPGIVSGKAVGLDVDAAPALHISQFMAVACG